MLMTTTMMMMKTTREWEGETTSTCERKASETQHLREIQEFPCAAAARVRRVVCEAVGTMRLRTRRRSIVNETSVAGERKETWD